MFIGLHLGLGRAALGGGSTPPNPPPPPMLVQEGDSITALSLGGGYPSHAEVFDANHPTLDIANTALGGATLGNPGDTAGTNSLYGRLASDLALAPTILTVLIGANDFTTGAVAAYVARIFAYTDNFKAVGCTVIVGTILPRQGVSGWNAARATANALIRAAVGDEIDDVVDYDTLPVGADGAENNATLYPDGLHPGAAAQVSMARPYTTVVRHWLGIANEPLDFAFAPQAAATVDTDYDSPLYTVAGLYPGETRPYAVQTGKAVSKNGGAFLTGGSGTVVNGNTLQVRNRSSADPATQTDVALTIGATTATYSVTSAGAGSRDWVPTDLGSKLKLWLRPEDIAGADTTQMATWPDASGNALTVTGGGFGSLPTVIAGGLNGFKTVRFNPSYGQPKFTLPAGYLTGRTSGSAYFVAKLEADPPASNFGAPLNLWGSATAGDIYPFTNGSVYSGYGSTTRNQTADNVPSLASWRFASFHSANSDWRYYVDGAAIHTLSSNTFGNGTTPTIGFNSDSGTMDGQIAEIIDCTDVLTTTERRLVEGYLAWKYGLEANLPSGHPYENEAPTI